MQDIPEQQHIYCILQIILQVLHISMGLLLWLLMEENVSIMSYNETVNLMAHFVYWHGCMVIVVWNVWNIASINCVSPFFPINCLF